jgi:hypothetical protein
MGVNTKIYSINCFRMYVTVRLNFLFIYIYDFGPEKGQLDVLLLRLVLMKCGCPPAASSSGNP